MTDEPMTLSDRLRMEAALLGRTDETDVFMEAAAAIERQRAGLEPFAEIGRQYNEAEASSAQHHADEGRSYVPHPDYHRVSCALGDCRRALEALNQ